MYDIAHSMENQEFLMIAWYFISPIHSHGWSGWCKLLNQGRMKNLLCQWDMIHSTIFNPYSQSHRMRYGKWKQMTQSWKETVRRKWNSWIFHFHFKPTFATRALVQNKWDQFSARCYSAISVRAAAEAAKKNYFQAFDWHPSILCESEENNNRTKLSSIFCWINHIAILTIALLLFFIFVPISLHQTNFFLQNFSPSVVASIHDRYETRRVLTDGVEVPHNTP